MFNAWVGLVVDRSQPDAVRQQRFLDAIDATLRTTVNRRLRRTQEASYEEDSSANTDAESMALLGVVAREHRARAVIVELFRSARSIPTDSGHSIEVPTIPMLPMRGMDGTDGLNGVWRTAANDVAFGLLAKIAPVGYWVYSKLPSQTQHIGRKGLNAIGQPQRNGAALEVGRLIRPGRPSRRRSMSPLGYQTKMTRTIRTPSTQRPWQMIVLAYSRPLRPRKTPSALGASPSITGGRAGGRCSKPLWKDKPRRMRPKLLGSVNQR